MRGTDSRTQRPGDTALLSDRHDWRLRFRISEFWRMCHTSRDIASSYNRYLAKLTQWNPSREAEAL